MEDTVDLFLKPKTMRERIISYAKQKGMFSNNDLDDFLDNIKDTEGHVKGIRRGFRTCRELAENGILRRLDRQEKLFRGYDVKIAVFEYQGE